MLADAMPTADIAAKLTLSAKTVETYVARIKQKLSIKTANELLAFALQWKHESIDRDKDC
ncbi:MAG: helix-turn-helix transcriptional regulator [Pirellulales bacterium]